MLNIGKRSAATSCSRTELSFTQVSPPLGGGLARWPLFLERGFDELSAFWVAYCIRNTVSIRRLEVRALFSRLSRLPTTENKREKLIGATRFFMHCYHEDPPAVFGATKIPRPGGIRPVSDNLQNDTPR